MQVAVMQQTFQQKLRELLEAKRMRQTDLARAMGVGPGYVNDYMFGRKSPGLDVVEKFAAALGCDPWELLDDTPVEEILTVGS